MFCKYRDIFGKVGDGIHSYRIYDLAIMDILGTILVALMVWWLANGKYNFFMILLVFFILGIIAHHIFCVRTTIDKWLFGEF